MPARSLALLGTILVAAAVGGAVGFAAQELLSHTVAGTVTDSDGKPLPGAIVELRLPASTGSVRTIVTGRDGQYRFERVVPGLYVLTVRLPGFGSAIRDLEIGDGPAEFRFDVQLNPWLSRDTARVPAPPAPERRVVCGLTMITPPNIDPKIIAPGQPPSQVTPSFNDRWPPGPPVISPGPPLSRVKPTIRTVLPPICWDSAPVPR